MPFNEIVTAYKLACQLVNWTAGQTLTALEQAMSWPWIRIVLYKKTCEVRVGDVDEVVYTAQKIHFRI